MEIIPRGNRKMPELTAEEARELAEKWRRERKEFMATEEGMRVIKNNGEEEILGADSKNNHERTVTLEQLLGIDKD